MDIVQQLYYIWERQYWLNEDREPKVTNCFNSKYTLEEAYSMLQILKIQDNYPVNYDQVNKMFENDGPINIRSDYWLEPVPEEE